ncbi:hypothetical protein NLM33_11665 [Bradyrhizobium sp. CCGUVB1N3]|uniref:hypothetical protein n=1 Tax=Bradyrhizobium sp. CCGUVB1N3 TaxID=2949629 RepID=UPI0020B30BEE|nr:hypothetical protein [Bradyrhizobium sp. CCGUVB1N3]MCP3470981.1 hypothetical protein [Bradyrhizobium sp. CCGUVB1N3]
MLPARHAHSSETRSLEVPASQKLLAGGRLGHRISARLAKLCNVRFDAFPDAAGTGRNTGTQFRDIGFAGLSGHSHREQAVLAGLRHIVQMRLYASLDPALTGSNARAQRLDVTGARRACLLRHRDGI